MNKKYELNGMMYNSLRISLLIFCLLAGFGQTTNAQVVNYNYAYSVGTYTPITGGTILAAPTASVASDDINYITQAIGFSFSYNNVSYSTVGVNSNGFIWFGTGVPSPSSFYPIGYPTSSNLGGSGVIDGVISAAGADLIQRHTTVSGGTPYGELRTETIGTPGNRKYVVQFTNWKAFYSNHTYNFQIILSETSNSVAVMYGNFVTLGLTSLPILLEVGIRGANHADGHIRVVTSATTWAGSTQATQPVQNALVSPTVFPATGTTFTWSVSSCPLITFNNNTATIATVGVPYTFNAGIVGTVPTSYAISIYGANLPAGITLNPTTGVVSGTPIAPRTPIRYFVIATQGGCSAIRECIFEAILVCNTITVTLSPAQTFRVGTPISAITAAATAVNGTAPYTYQIVSGALPLGLVLNAGVISGTPTTISSNPFQLRATDANGCQGVSNYNVAVLAALPPCFNLRIDNPPFPIFYVAEPLNIQLVATGAGATDTYTFSKTSVAPFPVGITMSSSGLITGTPQFTILVDVVIEVIATNGCKNPTQNFQFNIAPPLATSIDNSLSNLVKISPNPSNGIFKVDFDSFNMAQTFMRIYDTQGKTVFSSKVNSNLMVISLDKLSNGIYLLEVQTPDGKVSKRFIKE